MAPRDVQVLTPAKLATFYQLVGGNYDPLFLVSPPASIALIYRSLGCFHSLQPDKDPFAAPSTPALTPQGFVRWQTVQLLLGPELHVPYLQEAVKRFSLVNPGEGGPFPKTLPAACLPSVADADMCRWHKSMGERLQQTSTNHTHDPTSPPRSRGFGSDPSPGFRTMSDAAEYFHHQPSPRPPAPPRQGSRSGGIAASIPQIRTKFRNLNFSSTHSPHVRPSPAAASHHPHSPSPTSTAAAPPPSCVPAEGPEPGW